MKEFLSQQVGSSCLYFRYSQSHLFSKHFLYGALRVRHRTLYRQAFNHFYCASNEIKPPPRKVCTSAHNPKPPQHTVPDECSIKDLLLGDFYLFSVFKGQKGNFSQWNQDLRAGVLFPIIKHQFSLAHLLGREHCSEQKLKVCSSNCKDVNNDSRKQSLRFDSPYLWHPIAQRGKKTMHSAVSDSWFSKMSFEILKQSLHCFKHQSQWTSHDVWATEVTRVLSQLLASLHHESQEIVATNY